MKRLAGYLALAGLSAWLMACDQPQQLSALGPAPKTPPRATETLSQAEIGDRLLAGGEMELALKAYRYALAEEGVSHAALVGVGVANVALGRLGQARRILDRAVELYADSPVAWNNLGVAAYKQGDYATARHAFHTAYALSGGQEADKIALNMALVDLAEERRGAAPPPLAPEYLVVPHGMGRYELVRNNNKDQQG